VTFVAKTNGKPSEGAMSVGGDSLRGPGGAVALDPGAETAWLYGEAGKPFGLNRLTVWPFQPGRFSAGNQQRRRLLFSSCLL